MSAFAIFVLILTVLYIVYYSAMIMQDIYTKKESHQTDAEIIDVSQMQEEEPICITEDLNTETIRFGETADANSNNTTESIFEDKMEGNNGNNNVKMGPTAEEECLRLRESIEPIEVASSGGVEPDIMLSLLLNQEPGGPKIFYTRDKI